MPASNALVLASRHSRWRLHLQPERGACMTRLEMRPVAKWLPLAPAVTPAQWSADARLGFSNYALLPYSNRIAHGRLRACATEPPALPPNWPTLAHPLHGLGWLQAWTPRRVQGRDILLALRWPGGPAWPWAFEATQRLRLLGSHTLLMQLALRNLDGRRQPAGLGWHPYFLHAQGLALRTRLARQQSRDSEGLPSGDWDCAPAALREGRWQAAEALPPLDHCFEGWCGQAELSTADWRLSLTAGGALRRHCVIYRPPHEPYFCLEPVSHLNGALAQPAARAARWGLRWLDVGQSLKGSLRLTLR